MSPTGWKVSNMLATGEEWRKIINNSTKNEVDGPKKKW